MEGLVADRSAEVAAVRHGEVRAGPSGMSHPSTPPHTKHEEAQGPSSTALCFDATTASEGAEAITPVSEQSGAASAGGSGCREQHTGDSHKRPRRGRDLAPPPTWSADDEKGGKRVRKRPTRYTELAGGAWEENSLRQAIENSLIETQLIDEIKLPEAPVFRPSPQEFKDPITYIESIRSIGEQFGVVKIIPPAGWSPPPPKDVCRGKPFATRRQRLKHFKEGTGFGDGRDYTLKEYETMAGAFKERWLQQKYRANGLPDPGLEDLERDFWRLVETQCEAVEVEYANDLDTLEVGSGFPRRKDMQDSKGNFRVATIGTNVPQPGQDAYYERCGWNLNNLPMWPGSILRCISAPLKGVTVPWLYVGMLFTAFCWHNEDNYLYSINYMHSGAPKQWYSVPGAKAEKLEGVMKKFLRETFQQVPDLLHHMTTHFSPVLFQRAGVPVYKMVQEAGTFIITFPKSFHAGFNYGLNCAEAVNFALPDWVGYGREAVERYRRFGRHSVFSQDRLMLTLAHNITDHLPLSLLEELLKELEFLVKEERRWRQTLTKLGVRANVVERARLVANRLQTIDEWSLDYDDKRMCCNCKHVCFLSAVACECSTTLVSCLQESDQMCGCPPTKRFLMVWHELDELDGIVRRTREAISMRRRMSHSAGGFSSPVKAAGGAAIKAESRGGLKRES